MHPGFFPHQANQEISLLFSCRSIRGRELFLMVVHVWFYMTLQQPIEWQGHEFHKNCHSVTFIVGEEGVTSHKIQINCQNSAGVCWISVIFGIIIQYLVDYLPSQYICCITNTVLSVHNYLLQSLLWLFTPVKGQKVTLTGWKVTEWLFILIIEK